MTRLHARPDSKVQVDANRYAIFLCAHPDGLLGEYEVAIPVSMLKVLVGVLIQREGQAEKEQRKAARPVLVRE